VSFSGNYGWDIQVWEQSAGQHVVMYHFGSSSVAMIRFNISTLSRGGSLSAPIHSLLAKPKHSIFTRFDNLTARSAPCCCSPRSSPVTRRRCVKASLNVDQSTCSWSIASNATGSFKCFEEIRFSSCARASSSIADRRRLNSAAAQLTIISRLGRSST
jgi:hypothetical protein